MLFIRLGTLEDTIFDVDGYFDTIFEEEWFADEMVKEMILDVDKSVVLAPHCIQSPILGQIAPEKLSGGVKALILMLKEPELEVWATACGDNCAKWIVKISETQDITISLEHTMEFPEKFSATFLHNGCTIASYDEYLDEVIEYAAER